MGVLRILLIVILNSVVSFDQLITKEEKSQSYYNPSLTKLPFGCSVLLTHKFPKMWKHPVSTNIGTSENEIMFEKVSKYYQNLSIAKSVFLLPPIKKIRYIKIGNDSVVSSKSTFVKKYQYRLPDISGYKAFYKPALTGDQIVSSGGEANYELGELMLYNPKSQTVNVLLIYRSFGYNNDAGGSLRFFFITNSKSIILYDAERNESECYLKKSQTIVIDKDGIINVRNNR